MSVPIADSAENPTPAIKVLLVDDQRMIVEVVRRLLADEPDIAFYFCTDPNEAVARANEVGPTIILQDMVMPALDGIELVRRFRANPQTARTPIIVLSGMDDAESKSCAIAAGANDYLMKLPSQDMLVKHIRSKCSDDAARREQA